MTKFVGIRAKTYSYLIDGSSENKKAKGTKTSVIKRNLKFENYKNCLGATHLHNKKDCLAKNEITTDSLKRNHKQFLRNNKSILKTQQRFKRERHNVFTEEIKNIALKVVSSTFLLVCFVYLKETTCETRKNVYFTSKTLFILEIIKF